MKKQKLKSSISNLRNLNMIQGGDESFRCIDDSPDEETLGGYVCGEAIGAFCGLHTYEVFGCPTRSANIYCV